MKSYLKTSQQKHTLCWCHTVFRSTGKKYLPKLLESHVKLFLHCFHSKTTWPFFWGKTNKQTTRTHGQSFLSQNASRVRSNKNDVKLKMLLLALHTLFSYGYVYRKHTFSMFILSVILGNICWYLWSKWLEITFKQLSWVLCVVDWCTSADASVFINTLHSSTTLVPCEKKKKL